MSSAETPPLLRRGTLAIAALPVAGGVAVIARHTQGWELGAGVALCVVGVALALLCLLPATWHRRGLLLVASVGVALVVAEIGLQLFSPWGQATSYELHPRLLHRYIPGSSKIYRRLPENGGEAIPVRINARGYRGPPIAEEKRGLRIVVFGDSCVAAEFTELENTFVARLGVHLALASRSAVEPVNAGVVGYGPDQTLRRMELEFEPLDADVAVVVLFADNDYGDLLRNRLYRIGPDGRLADNGARIPETLADEFRFAAAPSALVRMVSQTPTLVPGAAYDASAGGLPLEEKRIEEYVSWCRGTYRSAVLARDPVVSSLLGDHYDADVSLLPRSESARYKVRLMELVMQEMQRVCARHEVSLVFVLLPSPLDMCEDTYHGRVNLQRYPDYLPTALCGRLEEIARRHGMDCVNLFPEFWSGGRSSLYFRRDNGHWNDAGQDLAARVVAAYLAK